MATRSKKSSTPSRTTPRPASPLSPTRHSRLQEKADLQNLNDRLATYIDRVRYLEAENGRLTREVQTTQETVTREVSNIKSMYDHELSDARRLLDETHREKAKLEIDTKRLWDENEELKATLAKKSKDLTLADNNVRVLETRANDLTLKYNQAQSDAKKAFAEVRELEKERDKLRKQVDELRKQLEEESLARVDVENHNQSLREELSFKDQVSVALNHERRVIVPNDLILPFSRCDTSAGCSKTLLIDESVKLFDITVLSCVMRKRQRNKRCGYDVNVDFR